MSFDTIMASATDSTIHGGRRRKPAHKSGDREQVGMGGKRQGQNEHVAVDLPGRECQQAGQCDRYDEQVDQHEIEREQPGRPPDLGLAVVLDDGDVELARQQDDGEQRQQGHRDDGAEHGLACEHRSGVGPLERLGKKCNRPIEHPERDKYPDPDESDELDDGLGRDRQHQSVLVLGRIDMARSEQHGENRHCYGNVQRDVSQYRLHRTARGAEDRGKGGRDCFELKRDVRDGPDDRDQSDGGGDGLSLAVACGNEVSDRCDVLGFREPHDAHDDG